MADDRQKKNRNSAKTPSGLARSKKRRGAAQAAHAHRRRRGGEGRGGGGIICPAGGHANKGHAPELHFRGGRQFAAFLLNGAQHGSTSAPVETNFAANDSVLIAHICSYPLPEPIIKPTGQGPANPTESFVDPHECIYGKGASWEVSGPITARWQ
jgi:hypothetical protein